MRLLRKKDSPDQRTEAVEIGKCLAKTERNGKTVIPGMNVEEHCLLSGYVSKYLAEIFPYLVESHLFPEGYDTVVALHDIGKISRVFQWIIYGNLTDVPLPSFLSEPHVDITSLSFKHTAVGQAYLNDVMKNKTVGQIIADHHGIRPHLVNNATDSVFGGIPYNEARKSLQRKIENTFNHTIPHSDSISVNEQSFLTGLTVVSDWISSARSRSELKEANYKELAERAVREAGFEPLSVIEGLSFEDIFGFAPRLSQRTFYSLVDRPGIYVLEAEMGQGKTEAALYASYKLLEKQMATGIYFALPTRLTSVAIHSRVESFLEKILEHSRKTKLIFQNSELYDYIMGEECNEDKDWFDSAKRSILYPFGVGTIDQALMSIINVKHAALRSFGLAGKVLIIDELHSYDVYTGSLVKKLINLVIALKGTVLVLSATLQDSVKNQILGTDLDYSHYPLASCLVNGEYKAQKIASTAEKRITIEKTDREKAIEDAINLYYSGQNVLWIENTVEEAQDVYRVFVSRVDKVGDVGLIHSRFTQEDRQEHENYWLNCYGKNHEYRKEGAILVGTQVLEQSLDIDADVLFTALAPVDMMLQRMGRLWRHPLLNKYRKADKPVCHIITPEFEEVKKKPEMFGVSRFVYSPYVLYRTLKAFIEIDTINIPSDIRPLIGRVYRDEIPDNEIVASLLKELIEKRAELERKADYASSNVTLTESDESARTRVSDMQTVSVLILRVYDYRNRKLKFLDGSEYFLNERNRKRIARKILSNGVKVGIDKAIPVQPKEYLEPLRDFTYISEAECERLRVVTIDEHGKLSGFSQENNKKDFHYFENMGYIISKERN